MTLSYFQTANFRTLRKIMVELSSYLAFYLSFIPKIVLYLDPNMLTFKKEKKNEDCPRVETQIKSTQHIGTYMSLRCNITNLSKTLSTNWKAWTPIIVCFKVHIFWDGHKILQNFHRIFVQGLLDLDGRNSQKYLHRTWADF